MAAAALCSIDRSTNPASSDAGAANAPILQSNNVVPAESSDLKHDARSADISVAPLAAPTSTPGSSDDAVRARALATAALAAGDNPAPVVCALGSTLLRDSAVLGHAAAAAAQKLLTRACLRGAGAGGALGVLLAVDTLACAGLWQLGVDYEPLRGSKDGEGRAGTVIAEGPLWTDPAMLSLESSILMGLCADELAVAAGAPEAAAHHVAAGAVATGRAAVRCGAWEGYCAGADPAVAALSGQAAALGLAVARRW